MSSRKQAFRSRGCIHISTTAGQAMILTHEDFRSSCTTMTIQPPRTTHQTGFKNKADSTLYIRERIILDMQNKDIQLSDMTNEEEERGSAGPEKGLLRNNSGREKETGESQTS